MSACRRRRPESPRRASAASGFTLIELVVALAISGLVVLTVVLAVGAASDAAARNAELQESARRDRNARMVLASLLRSARIEPERGEAFVGLDAREAPSGRDELGFTATPGVALGPHGEGEPVHVRVWRASRGIVAEIAPVATPGAADTLLLFPGADAMEIRYLDPLSGAWLDAWESPDRGPGGIAIGFGRERPLPTLVLHLPGSPSRGTLPRPAVGDPVGAP